MNWEPALEVVEEELERVSRLPPEERASALAELAERLEHSLEATSDAAGDRPSSDTG